VVFWYNKDRKAGDSAMVVEIEGLEKTDSPVRFIYYYFPTGKVVEGQFEKDLRPLGA